MAYPKNLGQPCWEKDQAEKCINIVAQVAHEKASLFLVTHSPIKNIKNVKADSLDTEEEAFQSLFSRKNEIRGVVRGGSGTGKSHLIRWINLRAEYAAVSNEFGLNQFKIVMVQRETGSLKSALKQIVDQLGAEFNKYIEDIRSSVDRFSAQTGREELIQELALEINTKWKQRGHIPFPKHLNALGDVLLSPGYRKWLGRDGGIVAQKIARLTESSTQDERETGIIFTIDDLIPPPGQLNRIEDAPQVHNFIEDLEFDEDIAENAVEVLNRALIDAQRELTGIKGAKLNEIFTAIRRKLYDQGKQLAVFIEDVTATSGGLDLDLFQAFEPKSGKDLCRMIALLGMTDDGWNVLPDNEKDRVDFEFDVGENAIQWSTDHKEVAQFASRYLNAIRCNDSEINDLAVDLFTSEISRSKCDDCPHRIICHEIYGYVQLEGEVKIGLFPFSEIAPQKLLKALNQERHRSSPRGLLDLVMNVALVQSYDQLVQNTFPNPRNFPIQRPILTFWTDVVTKYLGGIAWSAGTNRDRAKFLAEFWFNANSADEASVRLKSYLKPFTFPKLLDSPPPLAENCVKCGRRGVALNTSGICEDCRRLTSPVTPPTENLELKDLLAKLDEWKRGNTLTSDAKYRELLSKMIIGGIRWQDHRGVPVRFASDRIRGIKPIRIKNQTSRVAGQLYHLDFSNDEETTQLIEALVRYEHEGNRSWVFDSGELHKRRVYRWFRKNQNRIVKSLEPTPPSLTQKAVKSAAQLLAIAAIFRKRSTLPKRDPHKRVSELFTAIWDDGNRPQTLTTSLELFVKDVEARWENVKELLIRELGVGQGTAAPRDFIDPLPILEALENFEEKLIVEVPSEKINENFWKKRFRDVAKLGGYVDLLKKIEEEREKIKDMFMELIAFLIDFGIDGKDFKKELGACVREIVEVIEIQKKSMPYPSVNFDNLWESHRLHDNRDAWGTSVVQAAKVINNPKDIDTLCYDPTSLKQAWNDLTIVTRKHLAAVERELGEQENPGGGEQGGTKEEFLNKLKNLTTILDKE